jgi:hypothetical protein
MRHCSVQVCSIYLVCADKGKYVAFDIVTSLHQILSLFEVLLTHFFYNFLERCSDAMFVETRITFL